MSADDMAQATMRAGSRALFAAAARSRKRLAVCRTTWTKAIAKACKAYEATLAQTGEISEARHAALHIEGQAAKAEHADLLAAAKLETDKRVADIAKIEAAFAETMAVGRTDGTQLQLLADGANPGIGGMSGRTQAVILAALVAMDADGSRLDRYQRALLEDLSSAGLVVVDLGIDSSDANEVESLVQVPDDFDESAPDEDGLLSF